MLGRALEELHPNVFRHVSRRRFGAEIGRLGARAPSLSPNALRVGLMRFAALPGPRDGHTGLFPLVPGHRRQLHYGLHVVDDAGDGDLVGLRLEAVAGRPVEELLSGRDPALARALAGS
jgi:hypothetical protein